jgi:hypothetical protein
MYVRLQRYRITEGGYMIADILREHLETVTKPIKCTVGNWIDDQEPEVNELLLGLAAIDVNVSALFRSLEQEVPFRLTTFKIHMKGNCTCPKLLS